MSKYAGTLSEKLSRFFKQPVLITFFMFLPSLQVQTACRFLHNICLGAAHIVVPGDTLEDEAKDDSGLYGSILEK